MADIYLETDIDDSLRALVDYDSDGQSLTAHSRKENEIQVKSEIHINTQIHKWNTHKEESADDEDYKEELKKSKSWSLLTFK